MNHTRLLGLVLVLCSLFHSAPPAAAQSGYKDLGTLSSVTATAGQNVGVPGGVFPTSHTVQVNASSNPATCSVTPQYSVDGVTWAELISAMDCNAANVISSTTGKPARMVRANLTALTGTSGSTVKAKVETLAENDLATHATWAGGGDCVDSGGECACAFSAGSGTCTQAAGGFANAIVPDELYTIVYTIANVTGTPTVEITDGCSTTVALDATNGAAKVAQCTSATGDFVITATLEDGDAVDIDDIFFYQQNAANESPIHIITAASHNLVTGYKVSIVSTVGNTATNVTLNPVTVIDADEFTLDGTTGNAPWVSGGTITTAPEIEILYVGSN